MSVGKLSIQNENDRVGKLQCLPIKMTIYKPPGAQDRDFRRPPGVLPAAWPGGGPLYPFLSSTGAQAQTQRGLTQFEEKWDGRTSLGS